MVQNSKKFGQFNLCISNYEISKPKIDPDTILAFRIHLSFAEVL